MAYYENLPPWSVAQKRPHPPESGLPGTAFFDADGNAYSKLSYIEDLPAAGYYVGQFEAPTPGFTSATYDMVNGVISGDNVTFSVLTEVPLPLNREQFLAALDALPDLHAEWQTYHPLTADLLNNQSMEIEAFTDVADRIRADGFTVEDAGTVTAALTVASTPPVEVADGEPWVLGGVYTAGQTVTHDGETWVCRQSHPASAANWAPGFPGTEALWGAAPPGPGEIVVWEQRFPPNLYGAEYVGRTFLYTPDNHHYLLTAPDTTAHPPPVRPDIWTDLGVAL